MNVEVKLNQGLLARCCFEWEVTFLWSAHFPSFILPSVKHGRDLMRWSKEKLWSLSCYRSLQRLVMASAGWASFPVPSWFYCSVTQSCPTLQPHGLQYPRLPLSLTISQSLLKLMSLSQWCHPSISPSVTPFYSCPQSLPASGSFPMSWLFASGGQNSKASASASVLPMNIQGWFPLRSTGLIFLTKGLSRVLQHHSVKASILQHSAFFMVQLYIHTVQFSHSVVSDSLRPHEPQHTRTPCPSPTHRVHPNPCLLSQWCHPTISSSVIPFSSCPQSCPASGSFQMSQLFISGGQSIGVSASISVLPMNIQDWSP